VEIGDSSLYNMGLGQRVAALRKSRGFKVRQFALLAEIEHHHLINIEKGRVDMRVSTLLRIAGVLEVDPAVLLASLDS
jgi:transcriptional regulator with XRE-family HTH domain